MTKFGAIFSLVLLLITAKSATADEQRIYRLMSYDIFMRAEEGALRDCAVSFTYNNAESSESARMEDFGKLISRLVLDYAFEIDERLGLSKTPRTGRYVRLLIPYDCSGRLNVGKEIAKIGNERQSVFSIEVLPLWEGDPEGRDNFPLRTMYGATSVEWGLRKEAVRSPCDPQSWWRLGEYHQKQGASPSSLEGGNDSSRLLSALFFIYSDYIAGLHVDAAIEKYFDKDGVQKVVKDLLRYQLPRVAC